jgi:peptide deformylase
MERGVMITTIPNKVLTLPAKKVDKIDKKILQIIEKMKRALLNADNPKGVGLAAPQIGVSLRIFIIKPKTDSPVRVFINPEIIWKSDQLGEIEREEHGKPSLKKEKKLEGCLSIPNVWGHLKRPAKVKLRYMDIKGETKEEEFSGFPAVIIQHEVDHLNGVLFPQRVLEQKERLYQIKEDEKGNEKMVEIEI